MSTPTSPEAKATQLKPNLLGVGRQVSFHGPSPLGVNRGDGKTGNGGSPATPAKLSDIDPSIVSTVRKGTASAEHLRNASVATVIGPMVAGLDKPFTTPTKSSNKAGMLAGNWRQNGALVGASNADPFYAGPSTGTSTGPSSVAVTGATQATLINSDNGDAVKVDELVEEFKSPTPQPREDRIAAGISADNAQGVYGPECCIFIANLAAVIPDDELEAAVNMMFSEFGPMYFKVRRDVKGMPYGFIQYTKEENANKALEQGAGMHICGRPCRLERARANRSVYLSRTAGGKITEEQAREILHGKGEIIKLWYCSDTDKEVYRLADGIWVTFRFYQDAQETQNAFRDSKEFRVEVPFSPEEHERQRSTSVRGSAFNTPHRITPLRGSYSANTIGSWRPLARHQSKSIFVGGLDVTTDNGFLINLFQGCGAIKEVHCLGRNNGLSSSFVHMGFVEFVSEVGAKNALSVEAYLGNRRLRIEPRESPEVSSRNFSAFVGSPRRGLGPLTPRTPHRGSHAARSVTGPAPMMPVLENSQQVAAPVVTQTPVSYNQSSYYGSPYGYGGQYPTGTSVDPGQTGPSYGGNQVMAPYIHPGYIHGYYPAGYTYPYVYPAPVQGNAAADQPAVVNNNNTVADATPADKGTSA